MKNEPLTRKEVAKAIRVMMLIVASIVIAAFILCSCSPSLYRPTNGSMITWVTPDYIYTGTYAVPKMDSIPNHWGSRYCVGDIVYKY